MSLLKPPVDSPLFCYDREKRTHYGIICGVDEAGRGPLAGGVFAAAVILPPDLYIEGLNDSKKLSAKKRDYLFDKIISEAVCFSVASASVEEIERINILNAALLAMKRAAESLSYIPCLIIADGNKKPCIENKNITVEALVGGDGISASVAAASILAKVTRDKYMEGLDDMYPEYQFAKHKGYGTKLHYEMLEKYGLSPVHRISFLKKYLDAGE